MKSIEEKIEDKTKQILTDLGLKFYAKTEHINKEIDTALKLFPSKNGGTGGNYPDIKLLIDDIPVMIEIKGNIDKLIKKYLDTSIPYDPSGKTDLFKLDMSYNAIKNYSINGCLHYCKGILTYTKYPFCIGIGVAGSNLQAIWSTIVYRENSYFIKSFCNKNDLTYLKNLKNIISNLNYNELEKINI